MRPASLPDSAKGLWRSATRFLVVVATAAMLSGTGNAAAPGITETDKTFSEQIAAQAGAPVFGMAAAGGLIVFTRLDSNCGQMSMRIAPDSVRVATANGHAFPADGFALYVRPEPAHFDSATNSCDIPNPNYTSSTLNLTAGWTAGATQLANGHIRVVIAAVREEGGCAYTDQLNVSSCCTPGVGAVDLNGDGDLFDEVIQEIALDVDPQTRNVTVPASFSNTGMQAEGISLSTDGTTIASFVQESSLHASCNGTVSCGPNQMYCPGDGRPGQDLDGDGKAMSRVLRLYNIDTNTARNTHLGQLTPNCPPAPSNFNVVNEFTSSPAQRVQIGNGIVAFESDEFAPQPAGTFCDPNGGCTTCAGFPGRDYNGDGEYTDRVIRYFNVNDPQQTIKVGPLDGNNQQGGGNSPVGLVGTDGTSIAYVVQESGPFEFCAPCHDLTGDCDQGDQALEVYDIASKSVLNSGAAVTQGPMMGIASQAFIADGLVAFLSNESEMGPPPSCSGGFSNGRDLNGDGDTFDTILRLFDVRGKTIINTNIAVVDENSSGQTVSQAYMFGTDGTMAGLTRNIANASATVGYIADRCAGPQPVTCTALDQCHLAGTCDPPTGFCSNPSASSGTTCNDGDPCTAPDTCNGSGTCVSGGSVFVTEPSNLQAALQCLQSKLP